MLETSVNRDGGTAVVVLTGELDVMTADRVTAAVHEALQDGVEHLVIDMAAAGFFDSSGLAALLRARRTAVGAGVTFVLVGLDSRAAKKLRMTGTAALFGVEDA